MLKSCFLLIPLAFLALPLRAAGEAPPENAAGLEPGTPPGQVERPKRESVKMSPHARESAPRPDESGQMKRIAPPRAESPLQHVPALMEPPPGVEPPKQP